MDTHAGILVHGYTHIQFKKDLKIPDRQIQGHLMKSDAPSIRSLVQDCQSSDPSSKERLYRTFYGYLMGVTLRYVSTSDDAQELVNDSFMKIFKNIGGFSGPEDPDSYGKFFKGWIAKIASRTAIDHIRKQKTNFNTTGIEKAEQFEHAAPASMTLEVADIMALVNQLPENHKIVFNLHEVDGYTHEEIANMMQIPVSSSRVFLTRAKSKLRTLYTLKFSTC